VIEEIPARPFAFITRARLVGLAVAGALGLVAVLWIRAPHPGDEIEIRLRPAEAAATATEYLRRLGADPDTFRSVTFFRDDISGASADYLRERMSVADMARVYAEQIPSAAWRTRFFKPLRKEEYVVLVSPEGGVQRHIHQLDEKAPGEELDESRALARAQTFLSAHPGPPRVDLNAFRFLEHEVEARDARTDHTLVWERLRPIVGEATHRVTVGVQGDEVTGPRHWIKVPEEWERIHTRPTIFTVIPVLLFTGIALGGVFLFARGLSQVAVHWRLHVTLGLAAAVLQLAQLVNSIPNWGVGYTTSVPWSTSAAIGAAGIGIATLFTFIGVAGLAAVAETLLVQRFGPLTVWPERGQRGRAILEGLAAGATAAFLLMGTRALVSAALEVVPSPFRGVSSGLPDHPVTFLPGLRMFLGPLTMGIWVTVMIAGLAGVLLRVCRTPMTVGLALALCAAAFAAGGALSIVHFAKIWVTVLASLAVMAALLPILRFNLAAWLSLNVVLAAVGRIAAVWRHDALRPHALEAAIGLAALLVIVVVWAAREGKSSPVPEPASVPVR
jgi:hypothetical protein